MCAGGTEDVLRRFLGSFETSPSAMLSAFEPVRLATDMRHVVLVALQSAIKVQPSEQPCRPYACS